MTQARLKEVLDYHPESGIFRWKISKSNTAQAGDIAGTTTEHGYRAIKVDKRLYYAHRLAWLYMYGVWPFVKIDHKNGTRTDNSISNLRQANNLQNGANKKKIRQGLKGCYWNAERQKWQAGISINNKTKSLGRFNTEQEAHTAYIEAARALYGEFARAT